MRRLRIGPNLKQALFDPDSFFWRHPANYNINPMAFQDPHGVYVGCNLSFANMARLPTHAIIGKRSDAIFEDTVASAMEEARRCAGDQNERTTCHFWQTFGHGPQLHIACAIFPVFDDNG